MWHHPRTLSHALTRPLTERLYRGADAIVTYGVHVRRFLLEVPELEPAKVFVAGQAVEGQRFRAVEPNPVDPPEFLYVGQFEPRKGIDVLFDSVRHLSSTEARFRLIGSGSDETAIRERSAELNGRVEVIGHVEQEDLPAHLSRARALVLPSITTRQDRETWGLVVNEAMHAGVPVIASDAVGAAAGGLVRHEVNGLIVPERDPDALALAIKRLAVAPDLATRLGAQARRDVEAFNYDAMVDAFSNAMAYALDRVDKSGA